MVRQVLMGSSPPLGTRGQNPTCTLVSGVRLGTDKIGAHCSSHAAVDDLVSGIGGALNAFSCSGSCSASLYLKDVDVLVRRHTKSRDHILDHEWRISTTLAIFIRQSLSQESAFFAFTATFSLFSFVDQIKIPNEV